MFYMAIDEDSFKRFRTAVGAIDRRIRFWKTELPRLMFFEYYRRVLSNILTQQYADEYAPLDAKYARWKEIHSNDGVGSFWIKYRRVVEALKTAQPASIVETDEASAYIAVLDIPYVPITEYGYSGSGKGGAPMDIPARPVFTPTLDELNKDFYAWSKRVMADLNMTWSKK